MFLERRGKSEEDNTRKGSPNQNEDRSIQVGQSRGGVRGKGSKLRNYKGGEEENEVEMERGERKRCIKGERR